tara:strand:+ start:41777 stop:42070 length:294 start_codon:yes stop_codon:yes gene_type:complete
MSIKKEHGVKTNLITREGYLQLQQEHTHLWNVKRPEITKIVSWAASLGDRSENADYAIRTITNILNTIRAKLLKLQKLVCVLFFILFKTITFQTSRD